MKKFRKNFRKTFKNFRKYWVEDLVVDARHRLAYLVELVIIIGLTATITFFVTRNNTISELKDKQADAMMNLYSDIYDGCKQEYEHCMYEFTYENDVIVNVEITASSTYQN